MLRAVEAQTKGASFGRAKSCIVLFLAATIFHLVGLSPSTEFRDPLNRPHLITESGQPIHEDIGA